MSFTTLVLITVMRKGNLSKVENTKISGRIHNGKYVYPLQLDNTVKQ